MSDRKKKLMIMTPEDGDTYEVISFHPVSDWFAVSVKGDGDGGRDGVAYDRIAGWVLVRFGAESPLLIGAFPAPSDDYGFDVGVTEIDFLGFVHKDDIEKRHASFVLKRQENVDRRVGSYKRKCLRCSHPFHEEVCGYLPHPAAAVPPCACEPESTV